MKNTSRITQNNAFFKLLFENINEGLLVVNMDRKIVEVNKRLSEMFHYSEEELLDKDLNILIPDEIHKKHNQYVEDYKKKPTKKQMGIGRVLKAKAKANRIFYIETSLNHIEVEGEQFFVALLTDITKRVKAEQKLKKLNEELEEQIIERTKALAETQALYTAVSRNFPNGTINVFDKNFNYIFVEGKELFKMGITSEKLIGTSYLSRLPKGIKKEIELELKTVFSGKYRSFEISTKGQYYHIDAVPLPKKESEIDKILVVETNITKEKKVAIKLEESLKKEKEINEMKSRFVSMASHQFRTPLSTILSSVSLIDRYIKANKLEETEKHIKRIKTFVKILTDILNDFLSSDKLESKMVEVVLEDINVNSFFNQLAEELQTITKDKQTIKTTISTDKNIVQSDTNILRNIIFNLISNAIKYSNEGQDILLNIYIEQESMIINIIDYGMGIPKDDQKDLFNRFFRAKNALNYKGTGLGLNIVKSYLGLLKGNITFESKENKGTKFIIEIPIKNGKNSSNRR